MRTDEQTDMHDEANSWFRSFAELMNKRSKKSNVRADGLSHGGHADR
jgi:hypothetical protein